MLADSTEAVVRSSDDRSPETIDILVDRVMAERLAEGQLDQCDLTLRDLRTIAESFKASLRAIYHQRIQYPSPTDFEERQTEAAARVLRVPSAPMDGTAPPQ
jgi:membrane-associated HD superfamily phosphohydrolase